MLSVLSSDFVGGNSEAAMDLLGYRRDEIATVLTILYVLSGALRADRPVPVSSSLRLRFLGRINYYFPRNISQTRPLLGSVY